MTVAHLKKWCRQAHPLKEEDIPQPEARNKLVELARHAWEHSELPQELCCCVQVMIPKPDGGSRGIGLLEVVLKVIECIINARVAAKGKFHDCLHAFRAARGTDTAQIESKLFQQLQTKRLFSRLIWIGPRPLPPSIRSGPSRSFMSMDSLPRCLL